MKITKIYIHNFKSYRKTTIYPNETLNVFTGKNNCGKTTILEAISLWNECFRFLIVTAKKSSSPLNLRAGDYRLGKKHQNYIDYRDITSVRSYNFSDIFFDLEQTNEIEIGLSFKPAEGEENSIHFVIKAASGNNYDVSLKNHDAFNFPWLNSSFNNLPEPIGCFFASPVAAISVGEEFALDQKIRNKVTSRQSFVYIRNRIHRLSQKPSYNDFREKISYILNGESRPLSIQISGDISHDINIDINISVEPFSKKKEIALLGSGTLQIIELLLASYEEAKDINVILLDEPDSHIHRDIQKRLIEVLTQRAIKTQIFLTTHNESLIRSISPKYIFNISKSVSNDIETIFKPVTSEHLPQKKHGINSCYHHLVIQSLGGESSLDLLNAIDADKLIFVEGNDDTDYINHILETFNVQKKVVFWSFRGLDTLIKKISHYKDFLEGIGTTNSLWEKAVIVIDADFMTGEQKTTLEDAFTQKLGITTHIWSAYTFESTLIQNESTLNTLILDYCQSIGAEKEADTIDQAILLSKSSILTEKIDSLKNDIKYREKVTRQIQNRAKSLSEDLNIKNVFNGGDAMYFQNFEFFSNKELSSGRIDHLCSKDDTETFLSQVFTNLSLPTPTNNETIFSTLIKHCNQNTVPEEWKRLKTKLNL